jgi:branched-chain amino acid transport system permease protein
MREGDMTTPDEAEDIEDRDVVARRHFDAKQTQYLKTLVCDEVIEEHRARPLGQHSEPLERLLIHFRSMPMADKYAIKRDTTSSTFRIVALSGVRGTAPRLVDDVEYASVADAHHGIFLRRIKELVGPR